MAKEAQLSIRLTAALKTALERAAEADGRTVGGLVERILAQAMTKAGFLKAPTKKP